MAATNPRRALVSVSDKTDLGPFVQGLVGLGFEIISTGGTRTFLEKLGVPVLDISQYTGFPEIMDGRVKTLHPKVHGAILGRPGLASDAAAIAAHGIVPFELVVCNLYPFEATIAKAGTTIPEAIEQIDVGGPSMIRAAAKNHAYVGVVTRASQYGPVLDALKAGPLSEGLRRELAAAAFEMTARYDRAIADYMAREVAPAADEFDRKFPQTVSVTMQRRMKLRYGENPHQLGAWYVESPPLPASLATTEYRHGKELSYNNILDLDAALMLIREFRDPTAAVLKHNNPCGCSMHEELHVALERAWAGDPVSAFGSILGFNRPVDLKTAEFLCTPDRFVEAIIAPGYTPEAFECLTTRPKWRDNVRLMECPTLLEPRPGGIEYRRVTGGLLVQDRDEGEDPDAGWKVVTKRAPTDAEMADLRFAWKVAKHVKSNAIVYAKDRTVAGVGAGQMSRLDSTDIAARKAKEKAAGCVLASDAFFPFRDNVDVASKVGIVALIQPGGSRRDQEVIEVCNEFNMAMVFTGRRHFRH